MGDKVGHLPTGMSKWRLSITNQEKGGVAEQDNAEEKWATMRGNLQVIGSSSNKYLLSTYCVLDTMLVAVN